MKGWNTTIEKYEPTQVSRIGLGMLVWNNITGVGLHKHPSSLHWEAGGVGPPTEMENWKWRSASQRRLLHYMCHLHISCRFAREKDSGC
jgi:hypothetical protein